MSSRFLLFVLLGAACAAGFAGCDSSPSAVPGATTVRHLIDDFDKVIALESDLRSLQMPAERTQVLPASGLQSAGLRIAALPWPAVAEQLRVERSEGPLQRQPSLEKLRQEGGYLWIAGAQRHDGVDLASFEGKREPAFITEPPHLMLRDDGFAALPVYFAAEQLELRVRARQRVRPPIELPDGKQDRAMLQVLVDDQFQLQQEIVGDRWKEYSFTLKAAPGSHEVRLLARRMGGSLHRPARLVGIHWLEIRTPGCDRLVLAEEQARGARIHYRPRLPKAREPLNYLPGAEGRANALLLGGRAELEVVGEFLELQLGEKTYGRADLREGNLLLPEGLHGLHEIRCRGGQPQLFLHQPLAALMPILLHPDLRLRDDLSRPRGEGSLPERVEDWVLARLECRYDRRAGFFLPSPSRLSMQVEVRQGERLRFSVGVTRPPPPPSDGPSKVVKPQQAVDAAEVPHRTRFRVTFTAAGLSAQVLDEVIYESVDQGFVDREVLFEAAAGKGVLTFETETLEGPSGLPAFFADPRILPTDPDPRPNLILYLIDTLRADHLSCYGNQNSTSPGLDALAEAGYLFEDFYAVASWTRPTTATALTGLFPQYHGVHDGSASLAFSSVTLAECLRAAGYSTWAAITNSQISARGLHFEQGFHRFSTPRSLGFAAAVGDGAHVPSSQRATDTYLPWLERHGDEPFFLLMHTLDPHVPYHPPQEAQGAFDPEYDGLLSELFLDLKTLWKMTQPPAGSPVKSVGPFVDERDIEYVKNLYDEEILFQDRQITRLLDALRASGELDNTIVVVFSDHGEEFQEHGRWDHRGRMWQEHLHVPLILWLPPALRQGLQEPPLRIADRTSQVDLLPTLLDLLGVEDLVDRQGRSLRPLLQGKSLPLQPIYASESPDLGALLSGPYKLIWQPETQEQPFQLFHLLDDPGESEDLSVRRNDELQRLKQLRAELEDSFSTAGFREPGDSEHVALEAHDLQQLRALGYDVSDDRSDGR